MTGQEHTWNSFCISYSRSVRTKYWSDTSGEHFRQAKHGHSGVSHSGLIHACWSGSTVLQCLRCFNWFNCLSWRHQTCDHAMAAVMLPCSTWRVHFNHVTSNLFPPFFWDNKAEHNLQHWPMDLSSTPRCTQRIPVKEKKVSTAPRNIPSKHRLMRLVIPSVLCPQICKKPPNHLIIPGVPCPKYIQV